MPTRQLGDQRRNTLYHGHKGAWVGEQQLTWAGAAVQGQCLGLPWSSSADLGQRRVFHCSSPLGHSCLPDWTQIHPRRWSLPP